jgi:HSP20 family molecular chaperone IbpA
MLFPAGTKQSGPVLNISVVPANDQTARIQGAIARRAFLPSRPYFPGHELEDWLKAESELVSPLCYGLMTNDEEMWVGTSVAEFKRGTIEMWVSPRLITISGESVGRNEGKQSATAQRERLIFRVFRLPVEVEPEAITAELNGSSLELRLPKVHRELKVAACA